MELDYCTSTNQAAVVATSCEIFLKLGICEREVVVWGIFKPACDLALCKLAENFPGNSKKNCLKFQKRWPRAVAAICGPTAIHAVLTLPEDEPWSTVAPHLRSVIQSSRLGMMLFGWANELILSDEIESELERHLDCMTRQNITESSLAVVKRSMKHAVDEVDVCHQLSSLSRPIMLHYRRMKFAARVRNVAEEITFRVAARVKACGVDLKKLPAFPAETHFCVAETRDITIEASILAPYHDARVKMMNALNASECGNGEYVQAVMKRRSREMKQIDPHWYVEQCLISAIAGPGGADVVLKSVLAGCSSEEKFIPIKQTVQCLRQLSEDDVLKYCPSQTRADISVCLEIMHKFGAGAQIQTADYTSKMAKAVLGRLEWYAVHPHEDAVLENGETRVWGAKAIPLAVAAAEKAHKDGTLTPEMTKIFCRHAALLTPIQKALHGEWSKSLIAQAVNNPNDEDAPITPAKMKVSDGVTTNTPLTQKKSSVRNLFGKRR